MPEKSDDPFGRAQWFRSGRADRDGNLRKGHFLAASQQRHRQLAAQSGGRLFRPPGAAGDNNWTPLGPSVVLKKNLQVSGRVTALAVGAGGQRVYAGAANGGVWRSLDGGDSWSPLDEFSYMNPTTSGTKADSLSVGALWVRFGSDATTDELFVGTGEPGDDGYFGIGIKYSSNGGKDFSLQAVALASTAIYKIVSDPLLPASPTAPQSVFAATGNGLYRREPQQPSAAWSKLTIAGSTLSATDVVIAATSPKKTVYAAFKGSRDGQTITPGAVYESTDNGATWTQISGLTAQGRIALAVSESDPNVVYALAYEAPPGKDNVPRLFRRDRTNGEVFREVTGVPSDLLGKQGSYDIVVAVDPSNVDAVYLAGAGTIKAGASHLSLFGCQISGGTSSAPTLSSTYIGLGVHADAHALVFALKDDGKQDPAQVWVATDGGPFRSTQQGANGSFAPRNMGLNITQLTYLSERPDTDAVVYGGCQDNGTIRTFGDAVWVETVTGDGGGIAVDPRIGADSAAPVQVMRQYIRTKLDRTADGGLTAWQPVPFPPTANDIESSRTGFYAPIRASSDATSSYVAFGTNRLWISRDWGTTWVTLPTATDPYASGTANLTQDVLDDTTPTIKAGDPGSRTVVNIVDMRFASATTIYVATQIQVHRFKLNGTTWGKDDISIHTGPVLAPLTSIAVEDPNQGTYGSLYAAVGIADVGGVDHIWYFDGTGANGWKSAGLTTSVLDTRVNCLVLDPADHNVIYAGSDVGVWKGTKSGTSWTWNLFSLGLPEAAVLDLTIHARARLLRAATHGRGVWEIALDVQNVAAKDIYLRANYADSGRIDRTTSKRFSWVRTAPDPVAPKRHVGWASPDIKVAPIFAIPPRLPVGYVDFLQLPDGGRADRNGTTQFYVQVHNRGITEIPGAQVRVLLVMASATQPLAALPLPADFADRIARGDTRPWPNWMFVDPANPYRTLPGLLSARTPQVASFNVDLHRIEIGRGFAHVAAFVYTAGDGPAGTTTSLESLLQGDKHVAYHTFGLASGRWTTATQPMICPRAHHFATLLNTGDVVVTAGTVYRTDGSTGPGSPAEKYAASGAVSPVGGDFFDYARVSNLDQTTAVALVTRSGVNRADLYDFVAGTSTGVSGDVDTYASHTCVPVGGDNILVAGGVTIPFDPPWNLRRYRFYSVANNNFSGDSGLLTDRSGWFTAVGMSDGSALIVGGQSKPYDSSGLVSADRVSPDSPNQVERIDSVLPNASDFTMTRLADGRVLIAGGKAANGTALNSAYLFDPVAKTTTQVGAMAVGRFGHAATLLANGKVLVSGGFAGSGESTIFTAELYDPDVRVWVMVPRRMNTPRVYHTATRLPDGRVLVVGGIQASTIWLRIVATTAEIYDPAHT
jgi:Galactose oxidase, central domain